MFLFILWRKDVNHCFLFSISFFNAKLKDLRVLRSIFSAVAPIGAIRASPPLFCQSLSFRVNNRLKYVSRKASSSLPPPHFKKRCYVPVIRLIYEGIVLSRILGRLSNYNSVFVYLFQFETFRYSLFDAGMVPPLMNSTKLAYKACLSYHGKSKECSLSKASI